MDDKQILIHGTEVAQAIRGNIDHIFSRRIENIIIGAVQCLIKERNEPGFENLTIPDGLKPFKIDSVGNYIIEGSLSEIVSKDERHFDNAVRILNQIAKNIPYILWTDKNGATLVPYLNLLRVDSDNKTYTLIVNRYFVDTIMNFGRGFWRFNLIVAQKFRNINTQFFYELLYNNSEPQTRSMDWLSKRLSISKNYSVTDIKRFIFNPVQKEFERVKVGFNFTYEPIKEGRKIVAFKFTKVPLGQRKAAKSICDNRNANLQRTLRLFYDAGFSRGEIEKNSNILIALVINIEYAQIKALVKSCLSQTFVSNLKGYIISTCSIAVKQVIGEQTNLIDYLKSKVSSEWISYVTEEPQETSEKPL